MLYIHQIISLQMYYPRLLLEALFHVLKGVTMGLGEYFLTRVVFIQAEFCNLDEAQTMVK